MATINMFHGTPEEFADFRDGMIWLAGNRGYAEDFANGGRVMEVSVSINNPLDVSVFAADHEMTLGEWAEWLADKGVDMNAVDLIDWAPEYGLYTFFDLLPHAGNNYLNSAESGLLEAIQEAGYDSIDAQEEYAADCGSGRTIVVFRADQVSMA